MTGSSLLRGLMTLLMLTLLAATPLHAAAEQRLNVLLLFADDQQPDTIAALGNPVIRTPALDRLVRSGLSFDRAYMQGSMNAATCVPSRAMLLSGRSLAKIDEKLLRDDTWPAAFGRAGYRTFVTGKWHNGSASISKAFSQGRGIFSGGMGDPTKARLLDVAPDGNLSKPYPTPKHACEVFADEAIAFLQQKHEAPFFCYVPFDAPHDPHITPAEFPVKYDPASFPLPGNFLPQHPFDNGEMTIRDEKLLPSPRTPEDVRQFNSEYYRYISYLDSQVGRILDALERSPHAKNTIVIYAADSGVARGSHGLIGKQNLYEHSVRVPLIIAGPGIAANQRTQAMCYLFDLLPTMGQLCRVPSPEGSDGVGFAAVLKDPQLAARPSLHFAYKDVQRAIRDDRWKLIEYPKVNQTQLFDLQADPLEMKNLADQAEHASLLKNLREQLAKIQQDSPLPMPRPQKKAK